MEHPLKRKKPRAVNQAMSLYPEQVEQLRTLADHYGTKRSPVVGHLINAEFERLKEAGDIKC